MAESVAYQPGHLAEADGSPREFRLNFTGFVRVCFPVRSMYINSDDAPNQAIQRTSYPVPALMFTEDFDIKLQVKLTVVRRR
jgi:hypothetical protein